MPTIVALVKHVPDTWSTKTLEGDHTLDRGSVDNVLDEINEYSVEQALRLRDDNPDAGFRLVALTMGPAAADEALRRALAMGADDAVLLSDEALAGSDAVGTAKALSRAIATIDDVDLIVMGNIASDSITGLLAGAMAELCQLPALTHVHKVSVGGRQVRAIRADSRGEWELTAELPALVSVTDKADQPRFPNFKGLRAAKKHEITTLDLAAIGLDPAEVGLQGATTEVLGAADHPARQAGELVDSGSPEEKAARIADYLVAKKLI